MATYVILSRFSPEAFAESKDFKKLGRVHTIARIFC